MSNTNPSICCTLEAHAPLTLGAPLILSGVLRNDGPTAAWLRVRGTFLAGVHHHDLVLMRDGECLRDMELPGQNVGSGDEYVRVGAGGSLTASVDIASHYELTRPGAYQASLCLPMACALEQQPNQQPPLTDFKTFIVASHAINLLIGGEALAAARTSSTAAAAAQVDFSAGTAAPEPTTLQLTFRSMDQDLCEKYTQAHLWAYRSVVAALENLNTPHYAYWMDGTSPAGDDHAKRKLEVTNNLKAMRAELLQRRFTYALDDTQGFCRKTGALAGATYGSSQITLCNMAVSNQSMYDALKSWRNGFLPGNNAHEWARACLVIHEVSHIAAGTNSLQRYTEEEKSEAYLFDDCHTLATSNPNRAIKNAQNHAGFVMASDVPIPAKVQRANGIWEGGAPMDMGRVSPAGVAAASLHRRLSPLRPVDSMPPVEGDSPLSIGAPAFGPDRREFLMIAWQDVSTTYGGALWFKILLTAPGQGGELGPFGEQWTPHRPMLFADGSNCRSYQDEREARPAPALVGHEADGQRFFRCVYMDATTRRLQMVQTDEITDAMALSGDFSGLRWHARSNLRSFDAASKTYSPALANFDGALYCMYVTEANTLKCLRLSAGEDFVDLGTVVNPKTLGASFSSSPSFAVFNGELVCSARHGAHDQYLLFYRNGGWDRLMLGNLGVGMSQASTISLATWNSDQGPRLMGMGRERDPTSAVLSYWAYTAQGTRDFTNAGWGGMVGRTLFSGKTGAALVSHGNRLHAFYQHENLAIEHAFADNFVPPIVI